MNSGMVLGLIPARGGSKGIKKKNIRQLLGKPLISYTIECARACSFINKAVVSTDDSEIAKISRKWGAEVPFIRPAELAKDDTPMLPVMQHAVQSVEEIYREKVKILVLLDPTSPLRKVKDIEEALSLFHRDGTCQAVVSGCEAHHSPYFNMVCLENGFVQILIHTDKDLGCRQECPPVYDLDTTVWIYSREAIMDIGKRIPPRTRLFLVPEERSIHIDTELDFKIVEFLMKQSREVTNV
jgi:CMP-N,N'-diacetyllegionaminic acid synthase